MPSVVKVKFSGKKGSKGDRLWEVTMIYGSDAKVPSVLLFDLKTISADCWGLGHQRTNNNCDQQISGIQEIDGEHVKWRFTEVVERYNVDLQKIVLFSSSYASVTLRGILKKISMRRQK